MTFPTLLLIFSPLLLSAAAAPDHGRPPHPPPEEAFAACTGKAAGDPCAFKHGDRELEGSCVTPPDDETLVCAPARPCGR